MLSDEVCSDSVDEVPEDDGIETSSELSSEELMKESSGDKTISLTLRLGESSKISLSHEQDSTIKDAIRNNIIRFFVAIFIVNSH